MNQTTTMPRALWAVALLALVSAGCAAEVGTEDVASNEQGLHTLFPIFEPLLPQEVSDAVDSVRTCSEEIAACVAAAGSPSDLTACSETYAACVAGTVGVTLPDLPASDAVACTEQTAQCVLEAESVADLTACTTELTLCTEEALDVVETVDTVVDCTRQTADCILHASTPSELSACAEQEAQCVAGALGVDIPDLPVEEATSCAEDAVECTLGAERLSDIAGCGTDLVACAEGTVEPVLDCSAQFTQCLASNPFGFLQCAADLATCP